MVQHQFYQLQRKNGNNTEYVEVYNNTILLNARKHLEISVLRFGKVAFDESFIEPDNWNEGNYNPRNNNNNGNNYPGNNTGNNGNGTATVTDQQFTALKKAMNDAYFDNDKLTTGKVILKNNLFTVQQITELCKLFSGDERRLDFAKAAYDSCAEKGLFISVTDAFYFQSYKTLLLNFINSK